MSECEQGENSNY